MRLHAVAATDAAMANTVARLNVPPTSVKNAGPDSADSVALQNGQVVSEVRT